MSKPTQIAYENASTQAPPQAVSATTTCTNCQLAQLRVTVRRDFPLREGEKHGDWRWRNASAGEVGVPVDQNTNEDPLEPMRWHFDSTGTPAAGNALTPVQARPIFGAAIGSPRVVTAANPFESAGGQFTTDSEAPFVGWVRLTGPDGGLQEIAVDGSNADGEAVLETTGLDGAFSLDILPAAAWISSVSVGPDFVRATRVSRNAEGESEEADLDLLDVDYIYRPLTIALQFRDGFVVDLQDPYDPRAIFGSAVGSTHGRIGNRASAEPMTDHVPVSMKPVWIRHPALRGGSAAQRTESVDMVIVHCTYGTRPGNALNAWKNKWNGSNVKTGAQYILDIDGHFIKLAPDNIDVGSVGGTSDLWYDPLPAAGSTPMNSNQRSIAIEIINPQRGRKANGQLEDLEPFGKNEANALYKHEQYQALARFFASSIAKFPDLTRSAGFPRIIGHRDIKMTGSRTPRNSDPGARFAWEYFERSGVGIGPHLASNTAVASIEIPGVFDGVFEQLGIDSLHQGDEDATNEYEGDEHLTTLAGDAYDGEPIRKIRACLKRIGYRISTNSGTYDAVMSETIDKFKRHFFSGSRLHMIGVDVTNPDEREQPGHIRGNRLNRLVASRLWQVTPPTAWEFWLRRRSSAISARVHGGGVIGVFSSLDDASSDPAHSTENPAWEQRWGFECWLIRDSLALAARVAHGGIIVKYDTETNARAELNHTVATGLAENQDIWPVLDV